MSATNEHGNMITVNPASATSLSLGGNQIDAVSGASSYVRTTASITDPVIGQMRGDIKQRSQDFKALKSALKSNDLASATQAFTTLRQDIQKASQAAGGKSPFDANSTAGKDFQALGDALKSGDISAAKQAFATFKQDMKSAGRAAGAHRHHTAGAGAPSSAASAANTTTTSQKVGNTLNTTA